MDAATLQIAHLMRRAGFSCNADELQQRAAKGLDATITELINYESQPDVENLFSPYERTQYSDPPLSFNEIQQFWVHRMINSPRPLQEKMALFLHGHFATANYKVNNTGYMLQQYLFFRDHALSDFRTILQGVSRDPAMLVWLDNIYNNKDAPNENYAREVMELFTLGVGNYTEKDIKESARAFSGWQIKDDKFWINIRDHDFTNKTFFGLTGRFNGDDIIDILVSHPATAQFMAKKLLKFFASDNPAQTWVDRIAGVFTRTSGNLRSTVEAIFRSPEFYAADENNRKYKSPAEFTIGAIRELKAPMTLDGIAKQIRQMGQDLFNPPTVKGWDGGANWINTATMLARINFAGDLSNIKAGPLSAASLYLGLKNAGVVTGEDAIGYMTEKLNAVTLAAETRTVMKNYLNTSSSGVTGPFKLSQKAADVKVRNMVRLILSSPEYQFNWECPAPAATASLSAVASPLPPPGKSVPTPGRKVFR